MTNAKAILSAIQISIDVSDSDIEKVCIDLDINKDEAYSKANSEKVNAAAGMLLLPMLAVSSIGEGGFSISFKELSKLIIYLSKRSGGLLSLPDDLAPKRGVRAIYAH